MKLRRPYAISLLVIAFEVVCCSEWVRWRKLDGVDAMEVSEIQDVTMLLVDKSTKGAPESKKSLSSVVLCVRNG